MDVSCASQKQIRKVLRSRRISVSFVEPNEASQETAHRKGKKRVLDESWNDVSVTPIKPGKKVDGFEGCDSIAKISKKRKENVESKLNGSKPTRDVSKSSKNAEINHCERQVGRTNEEEANELSESESSFVLNENQKPNDEDNRGEIHNFEHGKENENESTNQDDFQGRDLQENLEVNEFEDFEENESEENCIENVLTEFCKDIGALYKKTSTMENDLKEIKNILKTGKPRHCIYRSISSNIKQKLDFLLLPRIPLTKKSQVLKMSWNCDEDEDYRDQLVRKLASYGGSTVNALMINIFKNLLSTKLKTKYCWKDTKRAKGKAAFKQLTGLRDVLWSAVKVHFEECTQSTITKEIKLRINQAQKDFDREMAINNNS